MSSGEKKKSRPARLLAHLARYGLTTRAIASRLFCNGEASKTENLFGKLLKQKRIVAFSLRTQPPLSYYTLSSDEASSDEAKRLGAPATMGRLTGRVINEALALLYFCHGSDVQRRRVPATVVQKKLGFPLKTANAPFVVQDTQDEWYLGRVIVPGREARPDYALKIIQDEAVYLLRFPDADSWLSEGTLRFIVLTYSSARRAQFTEAITSARSRKRIRPNIRVDVELVPDVLGPKSAPRPKGRTA